MPVITGFDQIGSVPEEPITDKIRRRVVSGKQGTMVYWSIKSGAHAAAHRHPHEQFVWMIKGAMDFRIGDVKRTMRPGDKRTNEDAPCCREYELKVQPSFRWMKSLASSIPATS